MMPVYQENAIRAGLLEFSVFYRIDATEDQLLKMLKKLHMVQLTTTHEDATPLRRGAHEGVFDPSRMFEGKTLGKATFWSARAIRAHPLTSGVRGLLWVDWVGFGLVCGNPHREKDTPLSDFRSKEEPSIELPELRKLDFGRSATPEEPAFVVM
jgi:hypothetical protein